MKKAIFVGYNQDIHSYTFTKGAAYEIKSLYGSDYVLDDDGYMIPLSNPVYDFLIKDDDDSYDFADEPASLKYFINGNLVTEDCFEDVFCKVERAREAGVETSSIKLEIKFE